MFGSPNSKSVGKLVPSIANQLATTYREEDSHLRKLTNFKNCITLDEYIQVAHRNASERIKTYHENYSNKVSEFSLTGQQHQQAEHPPSEDYVLIELTHPKRSVRLLITELSTEVFQSIEELMQSSRT